MHILEWPSSQNVLYIIIGESIRIPLHSPSSQTEDRSLLQELKSSSQSQESQETVIDAGKCDAVIEPIPRDSESNITVTKSDSSKRQSSTSSENIVFSIKLGSNNELFTTKLPKEKHMNKLFDDSVSRDGSIPTIDSRNGVVSEEFSRKQEDASSMVVEVSPKIEERSINDFERPSEENPTKQEVEVPKKEAATTKKKHRMSSRADEEANSSESELEAEGISKPKEGRNNQTLYAFCQSKRL